MTAYHDEEWGRPVHDDVQLFEMLTLEGAQAGLSWSTILKKREGYRQAFHNFDIKRVSQLGEDDVARLMQDASIIRNQAKILSTIGNARAILALQAEHGSFDKFIWQFVGGSPIVNRVEAMVDVPASTTVSDAMSKALLSRGFKFVGSTICYSFMQATGMVDDHLASCQFGA